MFFLVWIIIILAFFSVIIGSTKVSRTWRTKRQTVSSDGHIVPRKDDLTCETVYGHNHGSHEPRYIVHEEPTEGYVILNGIRRSLDECKYL